MVGLDDRAIVVEEKLDINDALQLLLEESLQSQEAMFGFLRGCSSDLGRGQVALVMSYVRGNDRLLRFFQRQVDVYRGALLRKSLLSRDRSTPEERVQAVKQAVLQAAEDLHLVQGLQIEAINALGEQVLDRHLRFMQAARELLAEYAGPRSDQRRPKALPEALSHEWGADYGGPDGDGP